MPQERQGIFITFEGGDGAGKSTHIRFISELLRQHGEQVLCLREPGGTDISERLRSLVLDPENESVSSECELLIYEAARAQLVEEVIRPALERGTIVLCDRFTDSTIAYQVFGRGLERAFVEAANDFACKEVRPDRTILMMTGGAAEVGLKRATHGQDADRLELAGTQFHERVNEAYMQLAEENPQRIRTVYSDEAKSETARKILAELADLFPFFADESLCTPESFDNITTAAKQREGR